MLLHESFFPLWLSMSTKTKKHAIVSDLLVRLQSVTDSSRQYHAMLQRKPPILVVAHASIELTRRIQNVQQSNTYWCSMLLLSFLCDQRKALLNLWWREQIMGGQILFFAYLVRLVAVKGRTWSLCFAAPASRLVISHASFWIVFPYFWFSLGFVDGLSLRCALELFCGSDLGRSGRFVLHFCGWGGGVLCAGVSEFGG